MFYTNEPAGAPVHPNDETEITERPDPVEIDEDLELDWE